MMAGVDARDASAPLAGARAVEVSSGWSAAAIAGSLLVDLGADCTHVPAGAAPPDLLPALPEPVLTWRDQARRLLLRSKHVVRAAAPADVVRLLARADLLVVDLDGYAFLGGRHGWEEIGASHPGVLRAAVTPYGLEGPLSMSPGTELTVQAASGVLATTGHPDGPPTRVGFPVGQHVAALNAVSAMLVVHRALSRTPQGPESNEARAGRAAAVEIAVFDGLLAYLSTFLDSHLSGSDQARRLGNRHPLLSPWNTYATADGQLVICAVTDVAWQRLFDIIGPDELGAGAREWDSLTRLARRPEIDAAIHSWTSRRPTGEALEALRAAAVPCAPVQTLDQALVDPVTTHRGTVGEEPSVGRYARPPFRISSL